MNKDKEEKIMEKSRSELSERDRKLLKRRLIDGIIYEKLAEEFNLSERQVKNIVYNSQDKIFKKVNL